MRVHSATHKALSDFDVVVIRPHSIARFLKHSVNQVGADCWIEGSDFARVEAVVTSRSSDILQLLERGGLLVVILDAIEALKWNPYAHVHSHLAGVHRVTNYDFLDKEFNSCVHNGSGREINIVDTNEPFSKVVQNSIVHWTAFMDRRLPCPFDNPRIFARNATDSVVGAVLECARGHIVFLPNLEELDEEEFLAACMVYRFEREGTNPPAWVPYVYLPGENEAISVITGFQVEIKRLQRKRMSELERREELLEHKKLLYEKGRARLEPAVRKVLDELGFQTTPPEVLPESDFEIHGRTTGGSVQGVLEVEGSNRQISYEEFAEFIPKLVEDIKNNNVHSKGIFVGNGLCEDAPSSRLGTTVFSAEVLEAAGKHSVTLVNSVELYWVVCCVLSKEITHLETIRETILRTSGYVDLSAFCGNSPFPTS